MYLGKTKAPISYPGTKQLIDLHLCSSHMLIVGFLMMRLKYLMFCTFSYKLYLL